MQNSKNILTVLRALEAMASEMGSDVPLTYVNAFLHVAAAGDVGIDQGTLVKKLDTSPSAGGRAVLALSRMSWAKDGEGNKKPGFDLIRSEQNPQNFRLRTL